MKATTLISIMAVGVMFASCSSDGSTPVDKKSETSVAASFSGNIKTTRAVGTTWGSGDAIGITGSSGGVTYNNEKYTTTGDGNFSYSDGNSSIYYQNATSVDFTAYYPFSVGGVAAGTAVTNPVAVTIDPTTNETTSAEQSNIDYLYGTGSGSQSSPIVNFQFKHKMCELTLNFKQGSGSIDLTNISYTLSGHVYLTGTFNTLTGDAVGTTAGTVTTFPVTGSKTSTSSMLILFPTPSTVDKASITLTAVISNVTYTAILPITSDGGTTKSGMASGNNYVFNITVNASGLKVQSSSIADWSSVSNNVTAS